MAPHDRMFRHEHAAKLDEAERRQWLPIDEVLEALDVHAGMHIADIGAGTGYFTIPLAGAVGPAGTVFAVDLQPEMLERIRAKLDPSTSVRLVHAEATRTTLPDGSVDLALLANVWHELDDVAAVLRELARIVRPGGRIAILDWRADVESPPGPPRDHRVRASAVESALAGEGWVASQPIRLIGPYEYLVIGGARP